MDINPIQRSSHPENIESVRSYGKSKAEKTAVKVTQIADIPSIEAGGLGSRKVTPLKEAVKLSQEIQKNWHSLELEDLAEMIVNLEEKVSILSGSSKQVDKIKKVAEHLHFQFVHPGAMEMEKKRDSLMPPSFVEGIKDLASRILKTNSLEPFNELTEVQKFEVLEIAKGGL